MNFQIGQQVKRIENAPQVDATIIQIVTAMDENIAELAYIEGGTGWWPVDCLKPMED